MLRRLVVDNLTVFDHAEVEFGPGLNVISGETGAGKTMLLQALRLIGGAEADTSLVGPRRDQSWVEAAFDDQLPEALKDVGEDGDEIVLARKLSKTGPSRALCSGRTCAAAQLAEASSELISLTGQHAARQLTSTTYQLRLLDSAANIGQKTIELSQAYRSWQETKQRLAELREKLLDAQQRIELLRHEQELLEALDPSPGEEEALEAERLRLANSEELVTAANDAEHTLIGSDTSLSGSLSALARNLESAGENDTELAKLSAEITDLAEQLSDAGQRARSLSESYDVQPGRLEEVEQRLMAISDLRRRFRGLSLDEIVTRISERGAELEELEGGEDRVSELEAEEEEAENIYRVLAKEVSAKRRAAARELEKSCRRELADLGLSEAEIVVDFEEREPSARGSERVRFLLRANPGLDPAPLDSGASGGELSRVNLALLLAAQGGQGCFLFDEIDAGIGGNTAHVVAAKLAALAENSQVIVVTHLAQIAVRADANYFVSKSDQDGLASASLKRLEEPEAIEAEIARLVGADKEAGKEAAELLRQASQATA